MYAFFLCPTLHKHIYTYHRNNLSSCISHNMFLIVTVHNFTTLKQFSSTQKIIAFRILCRLYRNPINNKTSSQLLVAMKTYAAIVAITMLWILKSTAVWFKYKSIKLIWYKECRGTPWNLTMITEFLVQHTPTLPWYSKFCCCLMISGLELLPLTLILST